MTVTGLVHININCSDYPRSKKFYEALGFREFFIVPETGPPEIAVGIGMIDYRVRGSLMRLESAQAGQTGTTPLTIDLLQWLEPHDETPPYPHLYHYGIARIALSTDDFDADVARMKAVGADFISDPIVVKGDDGSVSQFVCFRDPDGTVIEFLDNKRLVADPL